MKSRIPITIWAPSSKTAPKECLEESIIISGNGISKKTRSLRKKLTRIPINEGSKCMRRKVSAK
jgi:hypothetical protein